MRFSANLGFLFKKFGLCDAISQAGRAGFDAVEAHWPYETEAMEVAKALAEMRLPMIGINTPAGDLARGDFGLFAVPGREAEALAGFDMALAYGEAIGSPMIHAMAGKAKGQKAEDCFVEMLSEAVARAAAKNFVLLIEPINRRDVPDYFLNTVEEAAAIIERVGSDHLRMMFDCYHVANEGGDILARFVRHREIIGHVQFAAVPDRGAPDHGEVDYSTLLPALTQAGYDGYFGAEYRPEGETDKSLEWMAELNPPD